ncbi:MAG: hypothetical protein HQ596_08870 [Candidatus Saganbacteria bacterium]|nr:hypothetical protein [Candidatus Saganbacteria bacterium]
MSIQDIGLICIQYTNTSPVFKGAAVAMVGILALLFAFWMKEKWKEPLKGGFIVFIAIALFALAYGLFLLIFRPNWWALPY